MNHKSLGLLVLFAGSVAAYGGELGFGPGHASSFMVGENERAIVVGVSGLTWTDFALREYAGQGCLDADKRNQRFRCFVDSRIMDVEKTSDRGTDYNWCGLYSYMQALLWGGYLPGYDNEDDVADLLRQAGSDESAQETLRQLVSGFVIYRNINPDDPVEFYPECVVDGLVNLFDGCDVRMEMDVFVDHGSGDRKYAMHTVSLVGYSLDTTKSLTDPTVLKGLFVIDSDNDMYAGSGGRAAPDAITYCPISYESYRSDTFGYPPGSYYKIWNVFGTWGIVGRIESLQAKGPVSVVRTVSKEVPTASPAQPEPISEPPVDIVEPTGTYEPQKADTLRGTAIQGAEVKAAVQVKVGKTSKKGVSSVSVTFTDLAGKKYTSKSVKVTVNGGIVDAVLVVKKLGQLTLHLGEKDFNGEMVTETGELWLVTSSPVVAGDPAKVCRFSPMDLSGLSGALAEYFPTNELVTCTDKKWTVAAKAGKLKFVKANQKKGIVEHLEQKGDNIAGLKLTYAPKTQTFKGSFKVWTFDAAKKKLKSVSASVTGVVVKGDGYGQAIVKKAKIGEVSVK